MSHSDHKMPAARLQAIQDRRQSGAHGAHADRRERRARTRSASKAQAIGEFR